MYDDNKIIYLLFDLFWFRSLGVDPLRGIQRPEWRLNNIIHIQTFQQRYGNPTGCFWNEDGRTVHNDHKNPKDIFWEKHWRPK